MKKLAALLLIALAFCACEETEKLSIDDDTETPGNPDTVNVPTASFYVQLSVIREMPAEYSYLVSENNIPSFGKIWLTEHGVAGNIAGHGTFSSFRWTIPHDSNYYYNPQDILNLFENGTFSAIKTLEQPYGQFENVPYGTYDIVGVMGVPHNDTVRSYLVSVDEYVKTDSNIGNDTIFLRVFGYMPHVEPYVFTN